MWTTYEAYVNKRVRSNPLLVAIVYERMPCEGYLKFQLTASSDIPGCVILKHRTPEERRWPVGEGLRCRYWSEATRCSVHLPNPRGLTPRVKWAYLHSWTITYIFIRKTLPLPFSSALYVVSTVAVIFCNRPCLVARRCAAFIVLPWKLLHTITYVHLH